MAVAETERRSLPLPLRLVALWQVVGGLSGAVVGAMTAARLIRAPGDVALGALSLVLMVVALHLLAAVAGVQLWRERRWGYFGSLLVQVLQLTMISTAAHRSFFRLIAALYVDISHDIVLLWRVGSGYAELLAPDGARSSIGFNLFAVAGVLLLLRYRRFQRVRVSARADEVFR